MIVISSFIVIFAFSTVDHALSPMVAILQAFFNVAQEKILWLISSCTIGIVSGLVIGPQIVKSFKVPYVLAFSAIIMFLSLVAFALCANFAVSLFLRFVFGVGAGLISTVMWWLAYESIDRMFYTPMIVVLTASRPMAVAAGVPLVLYGSKYFGWSAAFIIVGIILTIFCFTLVSSSPNDTQNKETFTLKNIFARYSGALSTKWFKSLFSAMFINRICYFGFYSMLGIWFFKKYNMTTLQIAAPLMVIGICETVINFIVPMLMKIGKKKLFVLSVASNIAVFGLFIWGSLPLWVAITFIALFAMSDRVYNMLLLMFIPSIFPESKDKTTIGSCVTLVSWSSLAAISYIEGQFLDILGMNLIATLLLLSLVAGLISYYVIFSKTVFEKNN
ncbi:MAG: MFS transporter [Elusimicrobiota bacterium]|nr:MFS transporter [Elusimicrobiota bacterium]